MDEIKENQEVVKDLMFKSKELIEKTTEYEFVTFAGDNASVIVKSNKTNREYRICITPEE